MEIGEEKRRKGENKRVKDEDSTKQREGCEGYEGRELWILSY